MLTTKWLRTLGLFSATAILLAACGGGDEAAAPADEETEAAATEDGGETEPAAGGGEGNGVLEYGYVLPETGQLAFLGPPQIEGLRYAIQQINDAGGVLGEQVPETVGGDEAGDAAVASQSADRVLNAGVDALIGAAASGMSLAIIDQVTGAQVVQCSGSNTAPTFTDYDDGGYYFRTAPSDALQGPVLADTIIADGYANVAIAARADDYGQGLADATAAALEEAGATVAVQTTYDPNTTTFDATVQELTNANPDAIVVIAFEEGSQIIQGLVEAGFGADSVGLYGSDGVRAPELPELVAPGNPQVLAGMKGTAPAPAEDPGFLEALQEFAPDLEGTTYAGQVFDCAIIVALAAEAAGSDDPTVFVEEIVGVTREGTACSDFAECRDLLEQGEDIDYNGASGPLDFIDAGEPGQATIEVWGFNDQGVLEALETVETTLPEA